MSYMVIFQSPDGNPGYNQFEGLDDAVKFVEQLRNEQGVESARMFDLKEIEFELKPVYFVQMAELSAGSSTSSPPAAEPTYEVEVEPEAQAPAPPVHAPEPEIEVLPEPEPEAEPLAAYEPPAAPAAPAEVAEPVESYPPPPAAPAGGGPSFAPPPPMPPNDDEAPLPPPPVAEPAPQESQPRRGLFGR